MPAVNTNGTAPEPAASRWLTVADICTDLGVERSTWDKWVARRVSPPYKRLPNSQLRVLRADYLAWLGGLDGSAAA